MRPNYQTRLTPQSSVLHLHVLQTLANLASQQQTLHSLLVLVMALSGLQYSLDIPYLGPAIRTIITLPACVEVLGLLAVLAAIMFGLMFAYHYAFSAEPAFHNLGTSLLSVFMLMFADWEFEEPLWAYDFVYGPILFVFGVLALYLIMAIFIAIVWEVFNEGTKRTLEDWQAQIRLYHLTHLLDKKVVQSWCNENKTASS
eukprot:TRINITY_DN22941_c0_g1_i1.p1 TRINITY_DN22941_c0_g1~~TRINITY_DN22941_c0_g1_i1.p1  ORF type:complete len:200 (-),score=15.13 TRINITY_DN22941_c0_g1_i1:53-652(-)